VQIDSSGFIADSELVASFNRASKFTSCSRNLALFREGDIPAGLYILHKGAVTISTKAHGEPFTITLQTSVSSLLDLPGLVCLGVHTFTAVAHCGAEFSFV
jgi:hypothetical protein